MVQSHQVVEAITHRQQYLVSAALHHLENTAVGQLKGSGICKHIQAEGVEVGSRLMVRACEVKH